MTDSEQRGRNGWDGKGRWGKGRKTKIQGIEGDGNRRNLGRQRAKGWDAWSKDENKPPSHYLRSFLPNLFCLSLHIPTPKASSLLSKRDCRLGSGGAGFVLIDTDFDWLLRVWRPMKYLRIDFPTALRNGLLHQESIHSVSTKSPN